MLESKAIEVCKLIEKKFNSFCFYTFLPHLDYVAFNTMVNKVPVASNISINLMKELTIGEITDIVVKDLTVQKLYDKKIFVVKIRPFIDLNNPKETLQFTNVVDLDLTRYPIISFTDSEHNRTMYIKVPDTHLLQIDKSIG